MIVHVIVAMNRTVVDSDWRFDNLCHKKCYLKFSDGFGREESEEVKILVFRQ